MQLGDAEQVERGGHADRVDDGVEPADLVQVHPRRVDAVDPRLHLGDLPHGTRGNRHVGDPREQLRGMPLRGRVGDLDDGPRGPDPAPCDALGPELPAVQPGARHRGPYAVHGGTEVEQRAEQHVAGDPAERVEPQDQRRARRAIR
jgi:hypothetical protein